MKAPNFNSQRWLRNAIGLLMAVGLLGPAWAVGLRVVPAPAPPATEPDSGSGATAEAGARAHAEVTLEPSEDGSGARKEASWLGLSASEAPEALAAQLDLQPGVGLLVGYVAPESPAAKAGLRKNDVLTQFDDQSLVHPAQLRKLVRVRPPGTSVKLAFYRAGKLENATVTLGKARIPSNNFEEEERAFKGGFNQLQKQIRDMHLDETVRDQMRILRDSLGNLKLDSQVQEDIRRGMEQARTAIREAVQNMTNTDSSLAPLRKILQELAHSGVNVDDRADVVVRSSGTSSKTLVQSDESGTIVLVANPDLHLTVHDKAGKLRFDGPIATAEQKSQVPADLWERVRPLVDQMQSESEKPTAGHDAEKEAEAPAVPRQQ